MATITTQPLSLFRTVPLCPWPTPHVRVALIFFNLNVFINQGASVTPSALQFRKERQSTVLPSGVATALSPGWHLTNDHPITPRAATNPVFHHDAKRKK
jgi:hypothetical protein